MADQRPNSWYIRNFFIYIYIFIFARLLFRREDSYETKWESKSIWGGWCRARVWYTFLLKTSWCKGTFFFFFKWRKKFSGRKSVASYWKVNKIYWETKFHNYACVSRTGRLFFLIFFSYLKSSHVYVCIIVKNLSKKEKIALPEKNWNNCKMLSAENHLSHVMQ